jgi:hypothetical protein
MAQLLAMTALELLIMAPAILTSLATTVGSIAPVSRLERALGLAVTIGSALETGSREGGKQSPIIYLPMRFISLIGGSHSILEVVIGEIILIAEDSHQYRIPGRHLPHSNAQHHGVVNGCIHPPQLSLDPLDLDEINIRVFPITQGCPIQLFMQSCLLKVTRELVLGYQSSPGCPPVSS